MARLLPLLGLLVLPACGGTNPGGGNGVLFVTARLVSDGSTPGTRARVTVRDNAPNGPHVQNAEVALRSGRLGGTVLTWDDNANQYRLDGFAWDDAFRLEVSRGNDFLDGSIEAPGHTLITSPVADTTYRRGDGLPLIVQWGDAVNRRAARVQIRFDKAGIDTTLGQDGLELRVEPNELRADPRERVRVERTNEVGLAGGRPGSQLSAATQHSIEFRVE